jgi:hypothetical protein
VSSEQTLKVVADPRFDLDQEVDEKLYVYQKTIDQQVKLLSGLLVKLGSWEKQINSTLDRLSNSTRPNKSEVLKINQLKEELLLLKLVGRDKAVDRQVGAWQSSKITPYSATNEALKASVSRLTIPSKQDWDRIEVAKNLILSFEKKINQFEKKKWARYFKAYGKLAN